MCLARLRLLVFVPLWGLVGGAKTLVGGAKTLDRSNSITRLVSRVRTPVSKPLCIQKVDSIPRLQATPLEPLHVATHSYCFYFGEHWTYA